jgi:hypothetical protein
MDGHPSGFWCKDLPLWNKLRKTGFQNVVTCYATENTQFGLLICFIYKFTQSVIPLCHIYTAHNLTHQYSTKHYPCRPPTAKLSLQAAFYKNSFYKNSLQTKLLEQ